MPASYFKIFNFSTTPTGTFSSGHEAEPSIYTRKENVKWGTHLQNHFKILVGHFTITAQTIITLKNKI